MLSNKTAKITKTFVLQQQQISKYYPQVLSTEAGFYIYDRPLTVINVMAIFCALWHDNDNVSVKFTVPPIHYAYSFK